ncbi:MAG TPA: MFS transporter, partial [Anaerolineaceae bacterium]|nr:MFS transporter [Anaerolineaceae bacterium]
AGRLSTSLVMMDSNFSAAAISSATAVSGLAAIPAMLLFGFVSDRLGRAHSLALAYLLCASGALMLFLAAALWQFWVAASLIMIAFCANASMNSALVTDQLSPQNLSRGLSILSTSNSTGGIISFISAGIVIDRFGLLGLALLIAILPFIATTLLEVNQNPGIVRLAANRFRKTVPAKPVPCITDLAQGAEPC